MLSAEKKKTKNTTLTVYRFLRKRESFNQTLLFFFYNLTVNPRPPIAP